MTRVAGALFVGAFFAYLLGPLLTMGLTAFNSSEFPRVTPWECFSVEWFDVLVRDQSLMHGLRNSLLIGFGVVTLSVPTGLAGALMLTQVGTRLRPWYYTTVISPILIPGVVLGISTLVFWDRMGTMFHADYESFFYDGIFLTIMGQSAFVSAYCMLVFLSRLERFDTAQEEAALDLGATHVQAFRKVLLPFLKPAVGSAAVLAFLASFENYNTTVFTVLSESTLTTVLASKVRYGINPSISALAVTIVALTLVGAVVFEIAKRREERAATESARVARGEIARARRQRTILLDPALLVVVLVCIAGLGTVYFSGTIGVGECKAAAKQARQHAAEERIRELRTRRMFQFAAPAERSDDAPSTATSPNKVEARGTEGYRGIFAPSNLEGQSGAADAPSPAASEDVEAKGTEGYRGMFAPSNLEGQVRPDASAEQSPAATEGNTEAKGTEGYRGIFAPQNLKGQVGQ